MFKRNVIEVAECIGGQYVFPGDKKPSMTLRVHAAATGAALAFPFPVYASGEESFNRIYETVLNMMDAGITLVFIFAGGLLALGNRPRAMELLFCGGAGYILMMNATNLRDFLRSLVETSPL